jgi:hypothetical protein
MGAELDSYRSDVLPVDVNEWLGVYGTLLV